MKIPIINLWPKWSGATYSMGLYRAPVKRIGISDIVMKDTGRKGLKEGNSEGQNSRHFNIKGGDWELKIKEAWEMFHCHCNFKGLKRVQDLKECLSEQKLGYLEETSTTFSRCSAECAYAKKYLWLGFKYSIVPFKSLTAMIISLVKYFALCEFVINLEEILRLSLTVSVESERRKQAVTIVQWNYRLIKSLYCLRRSVLVDNCSWIW